MKSTSPYSKFAKIPFRSLNNKINPEINIDLVSIPASKAITVDKDDVLIVGDNSPDAIVIHSKPSQTFIGSHLFKVSNTTENDLYENNLIINVRSVNDSPIALTSSQLKDDQLNVVINQDEEYMQNLNELFFDEDSSDLVFSIIDAPSWVKLSDDNSFIYGTPLNEDVGNFSIIINAHDNYNPPVNQTINIQINNLNDAPEIITALRLPNIKQGDSLKYPLTSTHFYDKDKLIDENEFLNFEIISNNSNNDVHKWITIDKNTGDISITSSNENVGVTPFTLRVTDSQGLFIDQPNELNVENINDSPFRTDLVPDFDNPIKIEVDQVQSIDISSWFDDFDLNVDPDEKLDLYFAEDIGTGELKSIPVNDDNYWLNFDSSKLLLNINPKGPNIGENYLFIQATDTKGEKASGIVPIIVTYKNNQPYFNYDDADTLVNNIISSGVTSINPIIDKNTIDIYLEQQSGFKIDLPFNLFKDIDIGIDPDESLKFNLIDNSNNSSDGLDNLLQFDLENLSFKGNTTDLGLDSDDGSKKYSAILECIDLYGLKSSININFILNRTLEDPKIVKNNILPEIDEGTNISLLDLFNIDHKDVTGEIVTIIVKDLNKDIRISLDDKGVKIPKNFNNNTEWSFSGQLDQILYELDSVSISNYETPFLIGNVNVGISIYSRLGDTSVYSNLDSQEIN